MIPYTYGFLWTPDALFEHGADVREQLRMSWIEPVIPVHLQKMSRRELTIGEILLTIPLRFTGTPPPWKQHGWRVLYELTATWDMMLKDMQLLFILMEHPLIKRQMA
jgi:hypothetical protein